MPAPTSPYQPYAAQHEKPNGPGDARPTAYQIVKDCDALGKLKGKTVLITGCTAGLGVETARALHEAGARVFLGARDLVKVQSIINDITTKAVIKDAPKPEFLELHLDSLERVRQAAEEFKQRSNGQLNILINNAGIMAAPYSKTKDGLELHMATNHFAHFLLFQLLKPLLLKSAAESGTVSRVVNVSSDGRRIPEIRFDDIGFSDGKAYDKWVGYGQSKTANVYMANAIERRYGSQGIRGLSVHPGFIGTDLSRHMEKEDYEYLQIDKIGPLFKSIEQGAATTVWAAVSPHFERANGGRYLVDSGEGGLWTEADGFQKAGYASHLYNEEGEERLWKMSNEAVGLPAES